jgi:divalent metal cation (Fe/Co/Zn/Cd) transporter
MTVTAATRTRRDLLSRRAWWLAIATAAWNSAEAIVAIASGAAAGSIGLIGFGLDSCVEVMSAIVIILQFTGTAHQEREQRALRLIASSFFLLAAYVGGQSILDLVTGARPERSIPGMALAALSLVVMPLLAAAKRRVGRAMSSASVVADSRQTSLCTYLSAVLLAGLVLNAWLGWWWADPAAGLVIATLAITEGRTAWRGEHCNDCATCAPSVNPSTASSVSLVAKQSSPQENQ